MNKRLNGSRFARAQSLTGFTIVELLIVIVIIAILATITIIAYNGITNLAHESTIKSDLKTNNDALQIHYALHGSYPANQTEANSELNDGRGLAISGDNQLTYTSDGTSYCLVATYGDITYSSTDTEQSPQEGECGAGGGAPIVITDGSFLQDVTSENCPDTRTRAVDARDNHTYWIKKMDDGKCWMLTNLAYAGGTSNGGTADYSDVRTINKGTYTNNTTHYTYTAPYYFDFHDYDPNAKTFTADSEEPSTATTGGGSGADRQYGYHYNWCAAMGNQQNTDTCGNTNNKPYDADLSICPANWRLPTGVSTTGEFTDLNNAINSGLINSDSGLRSAWLAQYGGYWDNGSFNYQGSDGYYWSSSQNSDTYAHYLYFYYFYVSPAGNYDKRDGHSVRCVVAV